MIKIKSNSKFPQDRYDWKWLYPEIPMKLRELNQDGFKLVIFSNQAGIEHKGQNPLHIQGKILDMCKELGFPLQAFIASATDHWRKPHSSMWEYMLENYNGSLDVDLNQCMYVGDAAGRTKNWRPGASRDFSCCDRAMAYNIGIRFMTPEEFFSNSNPVTSFEWDSVDPLVFLQGEKDVSLFNKIPMASTVQEMILLVGLPASGKSTFARTHFLSKGYVHINQDTLKTKAKCMKEIQRALLEGKSVIVDNTNPSATVRKEFLSIAKSHNVNARCFLMELDEALAHHLNFYREKTERIRRIPDVAFHIFRKHFIEPSVEEGFDAVIKVPWIPLFADEKQRKLFLQRT